MDVSLVKGSGGIYTVEIGGSIVARKTLDRGFPTDAEVVAAVRAASATLTASSGSFLASDAALPLAGPASGGSLTGRATS